MSEAQVEGQSQGVKSGGETTNGRKKFVEEITLIDGVSASADNGNITIKGEKGELVENIKDPLLSTKVADGKIVIQSKTRSRHEKRKVRTYKAHLLNKIKGVSEGYVYKLKICSGHFPMNVTLKGQEFEIKNFLGEKVPRTLTIQEGATVKVEGESITVESADKEKAGQVAASIEQLCRITNRDLRIFQDGIYIIEKAGKELK
tara:strand:- start:714 stop:1322 length:609 start_codon:yes stop_codon:yes gene_type:complete